MKNYCSMGINKALMSTSDVNTSLIFSLGSLGYYTRSQKKKKHNWNDLPEIHANVNNIAKCIDK